MVQVNEQFEDLFTMTDTVVGVAGCTLIVPANVKRFTPTVIRARLTCSAVAGTRTPVVVFSRSTLTFEIPSGINAIINETLTLDMFPGAPESLAVIGTGAHRTVFVPLPKDLQLVPGSQILFTTPAGGDPLDSWELSVSGLAYPNAG